MQESLTFSKGMIPQLAVESLPPGAYLDALNIVLDESGNLVTESGISLISDYFDVIKAVSNAGENIVIAGIVGGTPTLVRLLQDDTIVTIVSSNTLGFDENSNVQIETKFNFKGELIIYLGGKGSELKVVNADASPETPEDLFVDYSLPQIKYNETFSGGNVKSGVYQLAARLVTSSNNKTGFCQTTGIIPVTNESQSAERDDYDGAPPQTATSSAISITVSGIDSTFDYIEPCVVTYLGSSNQISIKTLALIPIGDKSEISFIYSGEDEHLDTVLQEELSIDTTVYKEANYLTQKDGTLILSGVTESINTRDWQEVANSVKLKYYVSEKELIENISVQDQDGSSWDFDGNTNQDSVWSDIGVSTGFTDYRNPKTCESLKTFRRGETYSFTLTPVFGSVRGNAYHIPGLHDVNTEASKTTGDLGSSVTEDFQYPNTFGDYSNKAVRYHKMPTNILEPIVRESAGVTYVRLLGLEAEITLEDESWKEDVTGYIIGTESRSGKETVLAQGFTRPIYTVKDNIKGIVPSFGNMRISGVGAEVEINSSKLDTNLFTYHSPDLVTDDISFTPKYLQRIEKAAASYQFANFGSSLNRRVRNYINCSPGEPNDDRVELYQGITNIPTSSLGEEDRNSEPDISVSIGLGGPETVRFQRLLQCSILRGLTDIPRNTSGVEGWVDNGGGEDEVYGKIATINSFEFDLYNILQEQRNFYGDIFNKETYPVSIVNFNTGSKDPETGTVLGDAKTRFFNGDTFISKYSMMLKDTTSSYGALSGEYDHVPRTDSMVYFYLESNNNYNYRHAVTDGEQAQTLPYYPKSKLISSTEVPLGLLNYDASLGHATSYNKQYSAANVVQPLFTKVLQQVDINTFSNRVVYSATSIEGENFDAYRLFLPGNYHDIPKQFGSITGSFVQGSDLYFHTESCLWKSFYNTLATQASSVGDIVLGSGGAFPRPSIPIVTQAGGYAGCLDISASTSTPIGRYFYDASMAKLFRLSDTLQEVSNPAIFKLLRDSNITKSSLGYDYGRKRVLLSSPEITVSYSTDLKTFSSRHSYSVEHFISRGIEDYVVSAGNFGRFDGNTASNYFNSLRASEVLLVCVANPLNGKIFTGIEAISTSKDLSKNIPKYKRFFNTFKAYNKERNTGDNSLSVVENFTEDFDTLGTISVHRIRDRFRFTLPPDLVYNPDKDVLDVSNLVTSAGFPVEDTLFRPEMSGNYLALKFTLDGSGAEELSLQSIIVNYENNNI